MTDVPVNGKVLLWARKERGLNLDQAAKLLGVYRSELEALESGAKLPDVSMLRDMADKYAISFAALLMPEPLPASTRLNVTDFRTHRGDAVVWGPELLAMLDEVNANIDLLADLRDYHPSLFGEPMIPLANIRDNAIDLAKVERQRLGLTPKAQLEWKTESVAFRRLREMVEAQGIFVYVVKADTVQNWRGLTIYDERRIPVIVINGDEPNARYRIFSLMHEYAHILLRLSAISGGGRSKNATEKFCNEFAAYFLMPYDLFASVVRGADPEGTRQWTKSRLTFVADAFKLSLSAVAIHLEDTGFAKKGLYDQNKGLWRGSNRRSNPPQISHYEKMTNRLGTRHIDVVLQARERGIIDDIDAHELLDTQPVHFGKLKRTMMERRTAYGWGT